MKKIIAFLVSALFASAAFADAPVVEKSIAPAGSESLSSTQGLNNNAHEETAADAPEAADASGAQDADD